MATHIKSLEQASEMISKLQSQLNIAQAQKIDAQSKLYDLVFKDQPAVTDAELKSHIVYLQEELKKVIKERDVAKARMNEKIAECNLLTLKVSNYEKGR